MKEKQLARSCNQFQHITTHKSTNCVTCMFSRYTLCPSHSHVRVRVPWPSLALAIRLFLGLLAPLIETSMVLEEGGQGPIPYQWVTLGAIIWSVRCATSVDCPLAVDKAHSHLHR